MIVALSVRAAGACARALGEAATEPVFLLIADLKTQAADVQIERSDQ